MEASFDRAARRAAISSGADMPTTTLPAAKGLVDFPRSNSSTNSAVSDGAVTSTKAAPSGNSRSQRPSVVVDIPCLFENLVWLRPEARNAPTSFRRRGAERRVRLDMFCLLRTSARGRGAVQDGFAGRIHLGELNRSIAGRIEVVEGWIGAEFERCCGLAVSGHVDGVELEAFLAQLGSVELVAWRPGLT